MPLAKAYAALSPKAPLKPFTLERREPNDDDVVIDILYCGVCHSEPSSPWCPVMKSSVVSQRSAQR